VDGVLKTQQEHLTGQLPRWLENHQIAGMAGVVKTHTNTTSKVSAWGKTCLFACYATYHPKDSVLMMDPQTRSIVHFRDVLWLNWVYFKSRETPGAQVIVDGLPNIQLTEDGSVDSNEPISSARNKKNFDKSKNSSVPHTGTTTRPQTTLMSALPGFDRPPRRLTRQPPPPWLTPHRHRIPTRLRTAPRPAI